MNEPAFFVLAVCVCGEGKIPAEHTVDVHDELTGVCRSINQGISCGCLFFRDSGRRVRVSRT